jgi:CheY-like chemotaxis protein
MAYQLRNASILIVDDMEPMLALVSSLLEVFGFTRIYKANNAEDGLKLFLEHNPDIVLVDWQMEPFNGIELVRRMRADPKSPNRFVPIIMMTGFSHRIRVEEARDVGVTEFLVKPFKAKDLYTRIEQIAERPRRFVEAESFFGPDRRRKLMTDDYEGPKRREIDEAAEMVAGSEEPAPLSTEDAFFQELRHKARTIVGEDNDGKGKDEKK